MMLFFIHVCFFYVGCCAFQGYFFHATGTLSSTLGTFHCFTFPSTTSATSLNGRVFYLTFFPHISVTTCFYQSLPRSRKLFFEVCRASCWSSKRRPHPSVCLIHSIPESWYSGEFVFKSYQILPWITCGKKFSLSAPYSFQILFACSKPYVKIIENTLKKTFTAYNRFDENAHQSYF